jgi:hypothetical protein
LWSGVSDVVRNRCKDFSPSPEAVIRVDGSIFQSGEIRSTKADDLVIEALII